MKKFIFLAALAAWSVQGQILNGVVEYDGVVVVAGASRSAPIVYNEPVVYNESVHYDGPVIYNAPVIYNEGGYVNLNTSIPSSCERPYSYSYGYSYPQNNCAPVGYSSIGNRRYNYSAYSANCSPNVIYIGAHDPFRQGHALRHGL
jgi:hypothetical protein